VFSMMTTQVIISNLTIRGSFDMNKIYIDFGNDGYTVEAELKKDGNKWCVGIGDNLQVGVFGFGEQIWEAIAEFKSNFRNI